MIDYRTKWGKILINFSLKPTLNVKYLKLTQTNKIYYLRLTENDFVFCETCAKTIKAVLNSWEESEVDICF